MKRKEITIVEYTSEDIPDMVLLQCKDPYQMLEFGEILGNYYRNKEIEFLEEFMERNFFYEIRWEISGDFFNINKYYIYELIDDKEQASYIYKALKKYKKYKRRLYKILIRTNNQIIAMAEEEGVDILENYPIEYYAQYLDKNYDIIKEIKIN